MNGNNNNGGLSGPTLNGPMGSMVAYNGNGNSNGYPSDMVNCYTGVSGHHHHQQQQAQHNLTNNNSLTALNSGAGPYGQAHLRGRIGGLNNGLVGHPAGGKLGKGLNNGDNHIYHCNGMTGIVFCSGHF